MRSRRVGGIRGRVCNEGAAPTSRDDPGDRPGRFVRHNVLIVLIAFFNQARHGFTFKTLSIMD